MTSLRDSFSQFLNLENSNDLERKGLLERHKLGGVFKEYYPEGYKKYWVINNGHLSFLREEILSAGLECILLKGMHLIHEYYEDVGERFLGDIDILVTADQLKFWIEFLESNGFQQIDEAKWEANNFKTIMGREKKGVMTVVEIHTQLFYGEKIDWRFSPLVSQHISGLIPGDLFIHLCGHLGFQHTFHSLNWLYDIALLVTHFDSRKSLDWEVVLQRSKLAGMEKSCRITLAVLDHHFSIKSIAHRWFHLFIARFLITRCFLLEPYQNKFRYLIAKAILAPNLLPIRVRHTFKLGKR